MDPLDKLKDEHLSELNEKYNTILSYNTNIYKIVIWERSYK